MNQASLSVPAYEEDFALWAQCQIDLIRERQFAQLDIPNLLDELEYLVSSRKNQLQSRLRVLISHLLKWQFQPHLRSSSWVKTINTQRRDIEQLIEENPSFKRLVASAAEIQFRKAVGDTVRETNLARSTFPASLPYAEEQLLDLDFFP
jgi:hypothetical protein